MGGLVMTDPASRDGFSVTISIVGGSPVLALSGDLDAVTTPMLAEYLEAVFLHGDRNPTLDLQRLRSIDKTGTSLLRGTHGRLRAIGGALILRSPSWPVLDVLARSGLADLVAIETAR